MNILTQLQRRKDYQKYKDTIKQKVGSNADQYRRMDMLEVIKKQYEREENEKRAAVEPDLPDVPTSLPPLNNNGIRDEAQIVRDTIDCIALLEMISKDSKKCLVIDCRSEADYNESSIDFKFAFNIPESLCVIGMSITKLQQQMPNESKVFWNMRKDRSVIIFVDWFSDTFSRNSPPWYLRNLINEFDQEVEKKPEMLLLEGGYEKWLTLYPMKCTNPHVTIPRALDNSTPIIGEIEYPNLDDIVMKDLSAGDATSGTPKIDRSTKSNAIKSYEKNLTTTELLEKKKELLNKSLLNESQLMKLEQDYNEMSFNKENEEDATKETQLRYQIMELDSTLR